MAQVFAFMEKHGLGNQQALIALTLSTALRNKFPKGIVEMEKGLRAMTLIVQQVPKQPTIAEATESAMDLPSESSNISLPAKFSSDKIQSKSLNGERKSKVTQKAKPTTRKRSLETTATSSEEPVVVDTKRPRANSVSEEVTAKVEEASAVATRSGPPDAKVKSSPAVVSRNKRSRSADETETVHTAVALCTAGKRRKSSL